MIISKQSSNDGSIKYLWQLPDGATVESIFFTFQGQSYSCVSSQVGCNVGCGFCETGKQKNLRNVTADEIYLQVSETLNDLKSLKYTGPLYQVAVAGMGEPLLNFENVVKAAARLKADKLTENVSISTSGIAPKIRMLADTAVDKLFISLHATTDDIRSALVPTNKKYPISELLTASRYFNSRVGVPVTATYLMFNGVNDTEQDLSRLVNLLDPETFIIQLSEWNCVSNMNFTRSPKIDYFEKSLAQYGFDVFILRSKGSEIEGGCGQLRSRLTIDFMDDTTS